MYRLKNFEIRASEIAEYLNKELHGEDFIITQPGSIMTIHVFEQLKRVKKAPGSKILLITNNEDIHFEGLTFIVSPHPDLDMAYILSEFFASFPIHQIHSTALISQEAKVARNVLIGAYAIIGADVEIGEHTKILNHVIINGPVKIGKHCVIKDGAVIGSEGWGFIEDEQGIPIHPPQMGFIYIEDRVWIGSNTTIERGMTEETHIFEDAKVDDLVHIGAGAMIGKKSKITAGVIVASRVEIGQEVYMAPNSVIRENLKIADHAYIGLGSVVISDLEASHTYVGNPAKLLKKKEFHGEKSNE